MTEKITKEVMKKIKEEHVKMRPRLHFVLASALFGAGMTLSLILSAVVVHAMRFRVSRLTQMGIDPRVSLGLFLRWFPWEHLAFSIGAALLGLYLLSKFKFSYRKGVIALVVGVLAGILVINAFLDHALPHDQVLDHPHLRRLYEQRGPVLERGGQVRGVREMGRGMVNERKAFPHTY